MDCAADKGHVGVISLLIKADVPLNAKGRANVSDGCRLYNDTKCEGY